MKTHFGLSVPAVLFFCTTFVNSARLQSNPLGKVFKLVGELEAKIIKDGEDEAKAFKEFFNWCASSSQNINFEIKTGKKNKAKLKAKIVELASNIEVSDSKVEELSGAIAQSEAELKQGEA